MSLGHDERSSPAKNGGSAEGDRSAEPRFLVVGAVRAPRGLRGELRVRIETDFPERFRKGARVWIGDPPEPFVIDGARIQGDEVWLTLEGLNDRESVEGFRGSEVLVPVEEAIALPEDAYYLHQIIGLEVWTDEGKKLGTVSDVMSLPANDVYVVNSPQGDLWLPAIADVVLDIDLERRRMTVHLIPGLVS
jgi:16S rRNA processing protein RimM